MSKENKAVRRIEDKISSCFVIETPIIDQRIKSAYKKGSINKAEKKHLEDFFKKKHGFEIKDYKQTESKPNAELSKGVKEEKEHARTFKKLSKGEITTKQAIKDVAEEHLSKDSKYYTKLHGMESDNEEDLFEHHEKLPKKVQAIIEKYGSDFSYEKCKKLQSELKPFGYEFEYGLDAEPHSLRKIKEKQRVRSEADNTILKAMEDGIKSFENARKFAKNNPALLAKLDAKIEEKKKELEDLKFSIKLSNGSDANFIPNARQQVEELNRAIAKTHSKMKPSTIADHGEQRKEDETRQGAWVDEQMDNGTYPVRSNHGPTGYTTHSYHKTKEKAEKVAKRLTKKFSKLFKGITPGSKEHKEKLKGSMKKFDEDRAQRVKRRNPKIWNNSMPAKESSPADEGISAAKSDYAAAMIKKERERKAKKKKHPTLFVDEDGKTRIAHKEQKLPLKIGGVAVDEDGKSRIVKKIGKIK